MPSHLLIEDLDLFTDGATHYNDVLHVPEGQLVQGHNTTRYKKNLPTLLV